MLTAILPVLFVAGYLQARNATFYSTVVSVWQVVGDGEGLSHLPYILTKPAYVGEREATALFRSHHQSALTVMAMRYGVFAFHVWNRA